jgi:hypothetical protein
MNRISNTLIFTATILLPFSAVAQSSHNHSNHGQENTSSILTEPGQGGFAALTEVVSILNADPNTDWQTVNIQALRDHLVDMNDLILRTEVEILHINDGLRFEFDKSLVANEAAMRMVPAHSTVLENETGWVTSVQSNDEILIWEVTSTASELNIQKLGFFGLMATGDHHREHHLAIATGKPMY